MKKIILGFFVVGYLAFSSFVKAATLEGQILAELNEARMRPQSYSKKLEELLPRYDGKVFKQRNGQMVNTHEGAKAVKEAIKFLKGMKSLAPLQLSSGLSQAAATHVRDQGPKGLVGHVGTRGETLIDRVKGFGEWENKLGENISFGMDTGREVLIQLIVDDGISNRGHRKNIFNKAYGKVGISCGPHKRYGKMCVLDFAGEFRE